MLCVLYLDLVEKDDKSLEEHKKPIKPNNTPKRV